MGLWEIANALDSSVDSESSAGRVGVGGGLVTEDYGLKSAVSMGSSEHRCQMFRSLFLMSQTTREHPLQKMFSMAV